MSFTSSRKRGGATSGDLKRGVAFGCGDVKIVSIFYSGKKLTPVWGIGLWKTVEGRFELLVHTFCLTIGLGVITRWQTLAVRARQNYFYTWEMNCGMAGFPWGCHAAGKHACQGAECFGKLKGVSWGRWGDMPLRNGRLWLELWSYLGLWGVR